MRFIFLRPSLFLRFAPRPQARPMRLASLITMIVLTHNHSISVTPLSLEVI
ncbi:hypothetical protein HanIR_Chr10g0493201 [Helianthus annuus]|nr:hypothetical protein HanIR_Chr10g0493201 [Helianthus annuus]